MITRLCLALLNIFFPPIAVLLLTGPYTDTLLNCILFLCGVLPAHIQGFYISCTYLHRKKKVRKGIWPGGPKSFIFCEKIWMGGASRREWEQLELERNGRSSRSHDRRRTNSKRASEGRAQAPSTSHDNMRHGQSRTQTVEPRRSILGEVMGR